MIYIKIHVLLKIVFISLLYQFTKEAKFNINKYRYEFSFRNFKEAFFTLRYILSYIAKKCLVQNVELVK